MCMRRERKENQEKGEMEVEKISKKKIEKENKE